MDNRNYARLQSYSRVDKPNGTYIETYGRNYDKTPKYVDVVTAPPAVERYEQPLPVSYPVDNAPNYAFSNAAYNTRNAVDTVIAADRLGNPMRMSLMSQPGGFLAPRSSNMFVTPAQTAGRLMAQDPSVNFVPLFQR